METALAKVRAGRAQAVEELKRFLAFASVSSDPERRTDTAECADYTAQLLRKAGLKNVTVDRTARHPIVTGQWTEAPGKPTVLVYGHYDVQPVDPLELWNHPPFEAFVGDDRIWARGAADDKGQLFMHFKALEAIFAAEGRFPVNVKAIIEGEEEIGSPSLAGYLREHRKELEAEVALVSDTMMWAEGVPAVTCGLRGLVYLELEVTGPNRDLHSGSYGGAVANPAEMLARMLAQVKDSSGRIQIPGFYDQVRKLSVEERAQIASVPHRDDDFRNSLGVKELWGEKGYSTLERVWTRPTFEVNGIWGGYTGVGAKTVLPAKAFAKVSMRLVPDQDPEEIAALTERFFQERVPVGVTVKVTRHHGGRPVVVPQDNRALRAAARALEDSFGREPLFIREGGSIPVVADFKDILGIDTILVGFALPDARTHSPNENLHLPTFYTGTEALVRMYHYLAEG